MQPLLKLLLLPALLLTLLFIAPAALAHGSLQGANSFYSGFLHPLLTPSHLLLLLAAGLLFGQRPDHAYPRILSTFALLTLLGLFIAWFSWHRHIELLVLGWAAVLSLITALCPRLPLSLRLPLGGLAGLLLGLDSAHIAAETSARLLMFLGSAAGILFCLVYPLAAADFFSRYRWQRTGTRVLGSWIAASALLVLALSAASAESL